MAKKFAEDRYVSTLSIDTFKGYPEDLLLSAAYSLCKNLTELRKRQGNTKGIFKLTAVFQESENQNG